VGDAEQPAGQPTGRIERGEAAEGLDERLLRQILGQRLVARQADEQAEDRPLVAADDLFEGLLRARQCLRNQPGLDDGLEINGDGNALPPRS
jgi:hypothetical protein